MKTAKYILLENIPKDCWWEEMENITNTPVEYVTKAMESFAAQSVREDRESRWISVKERLPEDGEQVIVLLEFKTQEPESIASGYNSKKGFYNLEDPEHYWSNVTKWQPLPSPPTNKG